MAFIYLAGRSDRNRSAASMPAWTATIAAFTCSSAATGARASEVPSVAKILLVLGEFQHRKVWPRTAEKVIEVKRRFSRLLPNRSARWFGMRWRWASPRRQRSSYRSFVAVEVCATPMRRRAYVW